MIQYEEQNFPFFLFLLSKLTQTNVGQKRIKREEVDVSPLQYLSIGSCVIEKVGNGEYLGNILENIWEIFWRIFGKYFKRKLSFAISWYQVMCGGKFLEGSFPNIFETYIGFCSGVVEHGGIG